MPIISPVSEQARFFAAESIELASERLLLATRRVCIPQGKRRPGDEEGGCDRRFAAETGDGQWIAVARRPTAENLFTKTQ